MDDERALAALGWQIELGATEAIGAQPVNRYELENNRAGKAESPAVPPSPEPRQEDDAAATSERLAGAAQDLASLRDAIAGYGLCELQKGARNLVFADGDPAARLMIVGEAPGRDEDIEGLPFVGRAGQLLDRMLAAIGLSRKAGNPGDAVYITNVLPWRPPQNREPLPEEIAMLVPFLRRHIELADPDIIVAMGNTSCQALLGRRGITRLRGSWTEALDRPALPMFHPAYLLRNPAAKREAWADLLEIQARLKGK
ncbi:MAG: uracil-DNA glycosylase family protein [Paracoccaceae bacterium]